MSRHISRSVRLAAILSLTALGAGTAPAVSAGNPCFHGFDMPAPTTGGGTDVKLMPCSFEPTVTTVAVGTEVRFVNGSVFAHLITGANQAWGSREVEVQPNATVSYAFDRAGVYPYACALHPGMSGAIVVGDPADALLAGTSGTSTTTGSTDAATGASTGEDSMAAGTSAARATADATTSWGLTLALGAVAGLVVGAAAVWLTVRRRGAADRRLAGAE